MGESKLILLRHGQSIYNLKNIFTGWTDVELSQNGIDEAKRAGEILKSANIYPDICFSSWLKRAIHTAQLALKEMDWEHIDNIKSWKLNERHYGDWQGKNKDEIKKEVGDEKFLAVRRGYDTPPPSLKDNDPRLPENNPVFAKIDKSLLPRSESLKDTRKRVLNYFYEAVTPHLSRGEKVMISAHGNSLRALIMAIENLTPDEVVHLEIPTGEPIIYTFSESLEFIDKEILEK